MVFFSKKTYVCKKCGKEFQTRKTLWGDIVCDSCLVKEYELKSKLRDKIGGYEKYHNSVFYRDYAVAELQKMKNIEKCIPRHCGGTDVNCIYKYLKENRIKPNVMLIFTDGYFDRIPDDVV